jgi:hypothetical protein
MKKRKLTMKNRLSTVTGISTIALSLVCIADTATAQTSGTKASTQASVQIQNPGGIRSVAQKGSLLAQGTSCTIAQGERVTLMKEPAAKPGFVRVRVDRDSIKPSPKGFCPQGTIGDLAEQEWTTWTSKKPELVGDGKKGS